MQRIALIDVGSGNLSSVARAVHVCAAQAGLSIALDLTSEAERVRRADRIIFPGQGAFGACLAGLRASAGLAEALHEAVWQRGAPLLGICVGMQLMADTGLEHGAHAGLGWIGGVCRPLRGGAGRIPHMGWNQAVPCTSHPVLAPLAGRSVYFAHSYVVADAPAEAVAATTEHNERFASALAKDTIVAVQFHPEKSQAAGLAVMTQFLSWRP